jgi:hypothetical protein
MRDIALEPIFQENYMARRPRHIVSGQLYEMVFRAKEGIPLPSTGYMNLLVSGLLAKALEPGGITLCAFVAMGNHWHILFMPHCKSKLRNFSAVFKSSLTKAVKRVLGHQESLHLWDNRSSKIQVLDIDKAKERFAYLYSNPAKANLVTSITNYPGVSSWEAYSQATPTLDARVEIYCPFVREKHIPPIGEMQPHTYGELLRAQVEREITMTVEPHAWMQAFGIAEHDDVALIHQQILDSLTANEAQCAQDRRQKRKKVMSRRLLTTQRPTVTGWKPKKKERRIFFLSSCKDMRLEFLRYFETFCHTCRTLYEAWKAGIYPKEWPPEAYLPQHP